jgi:aminopeptidase N
MHRLKAGSLVLHGEELNLTSVQVDGQAWQAYEVMPNNLTIHHLPDSFELEIICSNQPQINTSLMGLYVSSQNFFTQCEAEGFRKITYFLDQPDVLAKYTVKLVASKADYPVLLSNGNLIEEKDLENGMHYAIWEDPFPKPSYLFALVAGSLKF